MIKVWHSHDEQHHTFASVSEIGDWIGQCPNPSIIVAEFPGRNVQLVIGDPTRREGTVAEFSETAVSATYDRTTAIRTWLARLEELTA
jgi:hypothetical protein